MVDAYGGGGTSESALGGRVLVEGAREVSDAFKLDRLLLASTVEVVVVAASRLAIDGCWTCGRRLQAHELRESVRGSSAYDKNVAFPTPGDPRNSISI